MLSAAALHSPLPLVQGLRPGERTLADLSPPAAQGWGTPGLLPKVLRGPGTATPTGQGPPALGHLRSGCPAPGPCPQPPLQALLPISVPLLPWLPSPALLPCSPSPWLPPPWSSKEGQSTKHSSLTGQKLKTGGFQVPTLQPAGCTVL